MDLAGARCRVLSPGEASESLMTTAVIMLTNNDGYKLKLVRFNTQAGDLKHTRRLLADT